MRQPFEPQNRAGPKARVLTRDRCFNIHWAEKDFFPCSLSFSLLFIPNPRSPSPGTSDSGGRGPVPPPPHPVPSSSLQPGARPWSRGCQSAAGCGGPSPQVDRGAPCRAASWSDLGLTPQTSAAPQRRQKRGLPPPPPLPTFVREHEATLAASEGTEMPFALRACPPSPWVLQGGLALNGGFSWPVIITLSGHFDIVA